MCNSRLANYTSPFFPRYFYIFCEFQQISNLNQYDFCVLRSIFHGRDAFLSIVSVMLPFEFCIYVYIYSYIHTHMFIYFFCLYLYLYLYIVRSIYLRWAAYFLSVFGVLLNTYVYKISNCVFVI